MEQLTYIFKRLTWPERVELLFYPAALIVRMPIAWAKSLWASRVLLDGQWSRYMGFNPRNALNSFFYRTQWLNVDRYGRAGVSQSLGLGNYPLSRWFHLPNLASYFFANAGAVTTLLGTLVWAFSHLLWMEVADPVWVVAVTLTLCFSSTAFAMAFTRQNYNMLGWMWLPVALYAVMTEHWAIAAMAWFAASLGSFTAIFVAVPLMAVYAIETGGLQPILVLLPATLKLALHLRPMIMAGGFWQAMRHMAKAIGITDRGVRYRRSANKLKLPFVYFAGLYSVSCLVLWWLGEGIPWLAVTVLVLFCINQTLVRFADEESMLISFVSVFAAYMISLDFTAENWVILWCTVSPLPIVLGISRLSGNGSMAIPTHRPFDHSELMVEVSAFLSAVPDNGKILFSFKDPNNEYEKMFDNYKVCLEFLLFVAGSRGIHLFPDWWAVFETNYEGAPGFWGRSIPEVRENMSRWETSYVITYVSTYEGAFDDSWADDFEVLSEFDWSRWLDRFDGFVFASWPRDMPPFSMYLLKRKGPQELTGAA